MRFIAPGVPSSPVRQAAPYRTARTRVRLSGVHHDNRGEYLELANGEGHAAFVTKVGATDTTFVGRPWHFGSYAQFKAAFSALEVDADLDDGEFTATVENGSGHGNNPVGLLVEADLVAAGAGEDADPKGYRLRLDPLYVSPYEIGAVFAE